MLHVGVLSETGRKRVVYTHVRKNSQCMQIAEFTSANLLLHTHTHTHTQNRAQILWHLLVFLFSLCVRSRDSLVKIATSSPNNSLLQDSSESGKLRKPPHYFSSTINQISGSVVLSVTFDLAQKEVNTADVNCKKTGCYVNTINFSTVRVRELYAE